MFRIFSSITFAKYIMKQQNETQFKHNQRQFNLQHCSPRSPVWLEDYSWAVPASTATTEKKSQLPGPLHDQQNQKYTIIGGADHQLTIKADLLLVFCCLGLEPFEHANSRPEQMKVCAKAHEFIPCSSLPDSKFVWSTIGRMCYATGSTWENLQLISFAKSAKLWWIHLNLKANLVKTCFHVRFCFSNSCFCWKLFCYISFETKTYFALVHSVPQFRFQKTGQVLKSCNNILFR